MLLRLIEGTVVALLLLAIGVLMWRLARPGPSKRVEQSKEAAQQELRDAIAEQKVVALKKWTRQIRKVTDDKETPS